MYVVESTVTLVFLRKYTPYRRGSDTALQQTGERTIISKTRSAMMTFRGVLIAWLRRSSRHQTHIIQGSAFFDGLVELRGSFRA